MKITAIATTTITIVILIVTNMMMVMEDCDYGDDKIMIVTIIITK